MSEDEIAYQDKFIEAKGYILLDKAEKSEAILVELYREDRSNVAIAMELATLYGKLDQPASQHKYAKLAADNAKDNVYVIEKYGDVCMETGKYGEAVSAFRKVVSLKPDAESYTDKLASAYIKDGKLEDAVKSYDQLESKIGVTQDVTRRKFELYDLIGDQKSAISELNKLIANQPANLEALHTLAKYHQKHGNEADAKAVYKKILAVDINDTKANIELMGGADDPLNDDNYLRALSPIIENKDIPIDSKVLELMQYVQKFAENGDPALGSALVEASQRLVAIHPNDAKSHAMQGDVLFLSANYKDAIKSYDKTLNLNDNVYSVWEQLMIALDEIKDYPTLAKRSTEAVDLFPNRATAFLFHGKALREQKKYVDALAYLEEGSLIAGKDLYVKSNLFTEIALTYLAAGDFAKANTAIDEAILISDQKNVQALEVKGDIASQNGDKKLAQKFWELSRSGGNTSSSLMQKLR